MNIDKSIENLLAIEGDYSNWPEDSGGPTRWGITEATARSHGYAGDMRQFPRSQAIDIYKREYWYRPGFDKIADHSPNLAEELFDTGVNMGQRVAAQFLQRALNALNRNGRDYADIEVDGRTGPNTLAALRRYLHKRGASGNAILLKAVEALQGEKYIHLAEKRPANEAFLYGWLANRVG